MLYIKLFLFYFRGSRVGVDEQTHHVGISVREWITYDEIESLLLDYFYLAWNCAFVTKIMEISGKWKL